MPPDRVPVARSRRRPRGDRRIDRHATHPGLQGCDERTVWCDAVLHEPALSRHDHLAAVDRQRTGEQWPAETRRELGREGRDRPARTASPRRARRQRTVREPVPTTRGEGPELGHLERRNDAVQLGRRFGRSSAHQQDATLAVGDLRRGFNRTGRQDRVAHAHHGQGWRGHSRIRLGGSTAHRYLSASRRVTPDIASRRGMT